MLFIKAGKNEWEIINLFITGKVRQLKMALGVENMQPGVQHVQP